MLGRIKIYNKDGTRADFNLGYILPGEKVERGYLIKNEGPTVIRDIVVTSKAEDLVIEGDKISEIKPGKSKSFKIIYEASVGLEEKKLEFEISVEGKSYPV